MSDFALKFQQTIAEAAEERWSTPPAGGTLPWPDRLGYLSELLGKLLVAGEKTGGPAFRAMSPPFEPEGASAALRATCRLGALRHHRGDAHRLTFLALLATL